jgi:hypothetical protein
MRSYHISFGPGIRRSLNESFKDAKARHGIVTSLSMSDEPPAAKAPRARPVPKPPPKEERDEVLRVIIGLIDQFCQEHLNEEYAVLCRKLAEKLARKRPSPLLHGSPNTWASGIVRDQTATLTAGWATATRWGMTTPPPRPQTGRGRPGTHLQDPGACAGCRPPARPLA